MAHVQDVANHILHLAGQEPEAEPITQMRLHKLLYYAQGWSLLVNAEPLFPDPIEAWRHGPVVATLRPALRQYEDSTIPPPEGWTGGRLTSKERALIASVWEAYKGCSAARLRSMTHNELPYLEARGNLPEESRSQATISREALRRYFDDLRGKSEIRGLEWHRVREAEKELDQGRGVPGDQVLAKI
jgi:uncharacterized phage-associated protein